ncbi:MAG TPA: hypothetical protein DCO79_09500 [Spirochaeta sp.]|nr:hypothetical protein [Spirochaeta sp.]
MSLIGVDIGSSGCKVSVYSADGELISTVSNSYSVIRQNTGCVELNCNAVEQSVYKSIREAADQSKWPENCIGDAVQGIAIASFGEAVIPIDKHGEIVGPSIFALDSRRKDSLERLKALGDERFYRINANILDFTFTYPKLVWYQENAPTLYGSIWKVLLWADFMVYRLTGKAVTNYGLASRTLLFDLWKEEWSEELLDAGKIDKRVLTELVPSGIPVGQVTPSASELLGIPETAIVASGMHDQSANALGVGAITEGSSVTGIGTVECTTFIFDGIPEPEYLFDLNVGVEHHVVPGRYVSFVYNQAGSLLTWFIRTFCKDLLENGMNEHAIFNRLLKELPAEPGEIAFLPFIEPGGAPSFIGGNRGCFLGMGATSGRGELYKAVLEGETMYFLKEFSSLQEKGLGIHELFATGGGSQNDRWLQIKADILGIPVIRPRFIESGTAGSAMAAGVACGVFESFEQAVETFRGREKKIMPRREFSVEYSRLFELYSAGMELMGSRVWEDRAGSSSAPVKNQKLENTIKEERRI